MCAIARRGGVELLEALGLLIWQGSLMQRCTRARWVVYFFAFFLLFFYICIYIFFCRHPVTRVIDYIFINFAVALFIVRFPLVFDGLVYCEKRAMRVTVYCVRDRPLSCDER